MKDVRSIIALAALVLAVVCCQKPEQSGGDNPGGKTPVLESVSIKTDLKSATATTVVLSTVINLGDAASMPLNVYLRYSLSESMSGDDVKTVKLNSGSADVKLSGLLFDRTYYYETYVELYGTEYNKVKNTFKTNALAINISEPVQSQFNVNFSGTLQGCGADDVNELALVLVITESDGYEQEHSVEFAQDGKFNVSVSGLDIAADYQYRGVVRQGALKSYEGESKQLKTTDPYKNAVKTFASATDLAASGSANSYIVSASGNYKFPTVKGNSTTSVGAVASVRILWESFGTTVAPHATELITATGYADGYAYLEVPAAYKEGNAVVAAYDSSDKILWSWHIWLTNDPIAEITYANNAGVMMDRNLGALTAEANSVGALGLYYQWGRKDPFLGAAAIGDPLFAVATRHLKVTLNTEATSTVDFAVANPHKFVLGNASGDWLATKDNSLWASSKTMYDPCPAGWRVPEGGYNGGVGESGMPDGIWAKAGFTRQGLTPFVDGESNMLGKVFSTPLCTPATWYPAAGSIEYNTGKLCYVGVDGVYHSTSAFGGTDAHVTGLLFNYLPNSGGHYIYCGGEKFTRAGGASVRCCKE